MNHTIVAKVARHFGIPEGVLLGRSQHVPISRARQMAMYLLYQQDMPFRAVGEELGRSAQTARYGVRRIERLVWAGVPDALADLAALEKEA